MAINVENVIVVKPKGLFSDEMLFDILFECTIPIPTAIRWEVIWVGCATSHDCDQILANVFVGPIEVGMNRFVLRANAPVITKIPPEELPLTVVMLKGFYKGNMPSDQEFIRIGYYVINKPPDDAPDYPDPTTVERLISLEDPVVQTSQIKWG
jgi:histone chaperone ASF1